MRGDTQHVQRDRILHDTCFLMIYCKFYPLLFIAFNNIIITWLYGSRVKLSLFQVINLIVLILYRTGYGGEFLGVGGTWNLNEDKNPDAEIVASGVFVGFFIYTSVVLITYCFGTTEHKKSLVVSKIENVSVWKEIQTI